MWWKFNFELESSHNSKHFFVDFISDENFLNRPDLFSFQLVYEIWIYDYNFIVRKEGDWSEIFYLWCYFLVSNFLWKNSIESLTIWKIDPFSKIDFKKSLRDLVILLVQYRLFVQFRTLYQYFVMLKSAILRFSVPNRCAFGAISVGKNWIT